MRYLGNIMEMEMLLVGTFQSSRKERNRTSVLIKEEIKKKVL